MSGFAFHLLHRDGQARRGRMTTTHGIVETPAFMPVGTQGTVKAVTPEELRRAGASIVLSNTYHLFLRPGAATVAALGGLHRFMNWPGPILTDSGGFQVFSLAALRRLDDEGVSFRSHIDGSSRLLTPEVSMQVQTDLGSDIAMVLDECPPGPAGRDEVERAVVRTTTWARRSRDAYRGPGVPFGIVQGGSHRDLRERCATELRRLDFPGYAIGGVSVGEPMEAMPELVGFVADLLPDDRPRYLMGVGRPRDLVEGVAAGIDLFDCVMPTRNARNGTLFTGQGRLNIKRSEFREDPRPVEEGCPCETCAQYSRAYLRHLFACGEILAMRLSTIHNLTYYFTLMRELREAIVEGRFADLRRRFACAAEPR